jgi:hypothetical protein
MRRLNRSHVVVALASSIATLMVAGGMALASIPDANGVIHGCIKSTGVLRVIDYPKKQCASSEKSLNWNQTGPARPAPIIVVNPTRVDVSTDGAWQALPSASVTVDITSTPTTALVRWTASPACFGLNSRDKYARIVVDGQQLTVGPIASIPPYTTAQSEIPVMLEGSTTFATTGSHVIGVELLVASNGTCAIAAGLWHLVVETFPTVQ